MKNILRTTVSVLAISFLASCYSGTPKGTYDSVAIHTDTPNSGATSVDTLPKTIDTLQTDTMR